MKMRYCYSEVTTQRENNVLVTYKNFENGEGRMTNRDNACAQMQLKNGVTSINLPWSYPKN